jgi:DNA-binding LacI/PurR family transcriptional regulator/DNA-binding transcriptional regulator YhcF (GntR family)
MIDSPRDVRRIVDLADRIEADIRKRRLKPGDRYLRTKETAKLLGVDATLANRALQLLVKRNRIERRPRVGTLILGAATMDAVSSLDCIHLLASDRQRTIEAIFDSGELMGLQGALPGVSIRFDVVPSSEEDAFLKNAVAAALKARDRQAFVLHGSTLTMQRAIAESTLPAIVRGRLHPSINLPFLDSDHVRIGALVAEYLLGLGHRRIVVLMRPRILPGDEIRFNAIRDAVDAAGLSARAITLRCLQDDEEAAAATIEELLDEGDGLPGIIVPTTFIGDVAMAVLRKRRLKPQRDVGVVSVDYPLPAGFKPPYAYIERTLSGSEQGALLGRMLQQVAREGAEMTENQLIPVVLRTPKS